MAPKCLLVARIRVRRISDSELDEHVRQIPAIAIERPEGSWKDAYGRARALSYRPAPDTTTRSGVKLTPRPV